MATTKKKTAKAKVKVKDLKAKKNPKGGLSGKIRFADGSVNKISLDRANKYK